MNPISTQAFLLAGALVLGLSPAALAHGENGDMAMDMGGMSQVEAISNSTIPGPPSYFRHSDYTNLMLAHIVLMTVAWVFVLPLTVIFSITRSRLTLAAHFAFLLVNAFGVLFIVIYNAKTPDLYPNNVHHSLGWLLIWIAGAQALMALVSVYAGMVKARDRSEEHVAFIPISSEVMAEHHRIHDLQVVEEHRFSNDSGQGTEPNTESLRSQSISSSGDGDGDQATDMHRRYAETDDDVEKLGIRGTRRMDKFFSTRLSKFLSTRALRIVESCFSVANRLMLIVGFVALTSGIVTYGGIFHDNRIFSGLAHCIKGGVFFWFGILTLGRWAGCFADLGWAWNVKPSRAIVGARKASMPSAEFFESFLIFFYGSTNVFLEHLAAWGNAWSAQDLEHVSITIMFFGGGLCGMLVESNKIRDLLNATITQPSVSRQRTSYAQDGGEQDAVQAPKTYGFSMNPLPGLVILLLGMTMSSHQQGSMVSSMVHKQWGTLLTGAALARGVTYILFYISPPTSILPSRPPSELISAFCLMAGGLIFMASNADSVEAMDFNNVGAMFVFTVTIGFVTFLMAWIILVVAIKGWAVRRESKPALLHWS